MLHLYLRNRLLKKQIKTATYSGASNLKRTKKRGIIKVPAPGTGLSVSRGWHFNLPIFHFHFVDSFKITS